MRICIITVAKVPTEYNDAMSKQFNQIYGSVLGPDTELVARGLALGPTPEPEHLPDYRNLYYFMLVKNEVVKAALTAEQEGFDAVVVNCFDDSGVIEARSVVNIPVFGICEPSLHIACQLGRFFGALVPDLPGQVGRLFQQVAGHGLTSRLLVNGVRKENKPFVESKPEADQNPEPMIERLTAEAAQLVHDGADVVLVACGGLGAVCDKAGLHHINVDGRRVPMLSPLTVTLKHTEMMVKLQQTHGIPIPSQAHDGFRLSTADKDRVQQGFEV